MLGNLEREEKVIVHKNKLYCKLCAVKDPKRCNDIGGSKLILIAFQSVETKFQDYLRRGDFKKMPSKCRGYLSACKS